MRWWCDWLGRGEGRLIWVSRGGWVEVNIIGCCGSRGRGSREKERKCVCESMRVSEGVKDEA